MKTKFLYLLWLCFTMCVVQEAFAQSGPTMREEDLIAIQQLQEYKSKIATQTNDTNSSNKTTIITRKIIIPVMFHVFKTSKDLYGGRDGSEDINPQFVQSMIGELNTYFGGIHFPRTPWGVTCGYESRKADTKIEFCAAVKSRTGVILETPGLEVIDAENVRSPSGAYLLYPGDYTFMPTVWNSDGPINNSNSNSGLTAWDNIARYCYERGWNSPYCLNILCMSSSFTNQDLSLPCCGPIPPGTGPTQIFRTYDAYGYASCYFNNKPSYRRKIYDAILFNPFILSIAGHINTPYDPNFMLRYPTTTQQLGAIFAHFVGSFLGLREIYGGAMPGRTILSGHMPAPVVPSFCGNDLIDDTPPQFWNNYNYSITTDPPPHFVTSPYQNNYSHFIDPNTPDCTNPSLYPNGTMFENIMDQCFYTRYFTKEQDTFMKSFVYNHLEFRNFNNSRACIPGEGSFNDGGTGYYDAQQNTEFYADAQDQFPDDIDPSTMQIDSQPALVNVTLTAQDKYFKINTTGLPAGDITFKWSDIPHGGYGARVTGYTTINIGPNPPINFSPKTRKKRGWVGDNMKVVLTGNGGPDGTIYEVQFDGTSQSGTNKEFTFPLTSEGWKDIRCIAIEPNGTVHENFTPDFVLVREPANNGNDGDTIDFWVSNTGSGFVTVNPNVQVMGPVEITFNWGDGSAVDNINWMHQYTYNPLSATCPENPGNNLVNITMIVKDLLTNTIIGEISHEVCVNFLSPANLALNITGDRCVGQPVYFDPQFIGTPSNDMTWELTILKRRGSGGDSLIASHITTNITQIFNQTFNAPGDYMVKLAYVDYSVQPSQNTMLTPYQTIHISPLYGSDIIQIQNIKSSSICQSATSPVKLSPEVIVTGDCSAWDANRTEWWLTSSSGAPLHTGPDFTLPPPPGNVNPYTYKVITKVYDTKNNFHAIAKAITVYQNPDFAFTKDPIGACPGHPLDLSDFINYSDTSITSSYVWNAYDTISLSKLSGHTIKNPIFNAANSGSYYYGLTTTDRLGVCSVHKFIEVQNRPVVANVTVNSIPMNNTPLVACSTTGTLESYVAGGTSPYHYNWGHYSALNAPVVGIYPITLGMHNDLLTVTDMNGCTSTVPVSLEVRYSNPVANAGPNMTICPGTPISITGTSSGSIGVPQYQWTTNTGVVESNTAVLNDVVTNPSSYTLKVTDTWSTCTATDIVNINVYDAPEVMKNPKNDEELLPPTQSFCAQITETFNGADYILNRNGYRFWWENEERAELSNNEVLDLTIPDSSCYIYLVAQSESTPCLYRYPLRISVVNERFSRIQPGIRFVSKELHTDGSLLLLTFDQLRNGGLPFTYYVPSCLSNAHTQHYNLCLSTSPETGVVGGTEPVLSKYKHYNTYDFKLYRINIDGSDYEDLTDELEVKSPYTNDSFYNARFWEVSKDYFANNTGEEQYYLEVTITNRCGNSHTETYLLCGAFDGVEVWSTHVIAGNTYIDNHCQDKDILGYNFAPSFPFTSTISDSRGTDKINKLDYEDDGVTTYFGRNINTDGPLEINGASGNVSFIADNTVTLLPGFYARPGATFKASIDEVCSNNPTGRIGRVDRKDSVSVTEKSVKELINNSFMSIYPNPTNSDKINLEINSTSNQACTIKVFNALGSLLITMKENVVTGKNIYQIPLNKFAAGNYFIEFNTDTMAKTSPFVIMK